MNVSHRRQDTSGDASNGMAHRLGRAEEGLHVLGTGVFSIEGDVHKLVTFLNQTLKENGYIFGVSKHPQGLAFTIYQAEASR